MIARWFLMILALMPLHQSLQAGVWNNLTGYFKSKPAPQPPSIKVLIVHDVPKVNLEVTGKYSLYDPHVKDTDDDDIHITSRFVGKRHEITTMSDGLKWGEAFPGIYQIKITPDDASTLSVVDGREYTGSVYIYDIGSSISLVNQVPIEDYVRYILAHFPDEGLHPEVLNAIAIVARTNAYYQTENPKTSFWAVDAQKVGYGGRYPVPRGIESAVTMSRYMIMSKTGVYERSVTPFAAQFDNLSPAAVKDVEVSKITLAEANEMAQRGDHAAQILARAFPGTTIMLMNYAN